jgi:hypothetical protein
MKSKHAALLLIAASIGWCGRAKADTFTLDFEQVGANVVATGSGSINTSDLELSGLENAQPQVIGPAPEFLVGNSGAGYEQLRSFGSGYVSPVFDTSSAPHAASSGAGYVVGFGFSSSTVEYIDTSESYVSGAALSDVTTWDNQTFASLGLTPGTYTYDYGSESTPDTIVVDIGTAAATPEPPSVTLLAAALLPFLALRIHSGYRRAARADHIAAG